VARWAGWGAGPAGAGATGGPSRGFLALALVASGLAAAALAKQGNLPGALLCAAGALYFALRLFAGLGREKR
jgi:hypothetical protein